LCVHVRDGTERQPKSTAVDEVVVRKFKIGHYDSREK